MFYIIAEKYVVFVSDSHYQCIYTSLLQRQLNIPTSLTAPNLDLKHKRLVDRGNLKHYKNQKEEMFCQVMST